VIFKTSPAKAEAAIKRIAALHRYDVPAVIRLSSEAAYQPFAEWVAAETR
jgi:periplasmic divalent cation tolerance protein